MMARVRGPGRSGKAKDVLGSQFSTRPKQHGFRFDEREGFDHVLGR
ncbi:MAG: hypothetical protein QOH35_5145 [Acidobacteriaceae bacterium]|jgi:hypothetical protein|nr:hypothetical protein [Acidobacteriaceae bacterium]